jgi:hypothetical protein
MKKNPSNLELIKKKYIELQICVYKRISHNTYNRIWWNVEKVKNSEIETWIEIDRQEKETLS